MVGFSLHLGNNARPKATRRAAGCNGQTGTALAAARIHPARTRLLIPARVFSILTVWTPRGSFQPCRSSKSEMSWVQCSGDLSSVVTTTGAEADQELEILARRVEHSLRTPSGPRALRSVSRRKLSLTLDLIPVKSLNVRDLRRPPAGAGARRSCGRPSRRRRVADAWGTITICPGRLRSGSELGQTKAQYRAGLRPSITNRTICQMGERRRN